MFPKVFISYSHDSLEHKKWVLDLATRLRQNGIDAGIDQWDLQAGDDIPLFMERNLSESDFTLMVCSERYVEKANLSSVGVGYEKMIVTADLSRNIDSKRVIPVIRQAGTRNVPIFLQTKLFIDFSKDEEFEYAYDQLVRTIHRSPLFEKPPVGNNPFEHAQPAKPEKQLDSLYEAMKIIAFAFESNSKKEISYDRLYKINKDAGVMTRSMFDVQLAQARSRGFVEIDLINRVTVLDLGLKYIIENKLDI